MEFNIYVPKWVIILGLIMLLIIIVKMIENFLTELWDKRVVLFDLSFVPVIKAIIYVWVRGAPTVKRMTKGKDIGVSKDRVVKNINGDVEHFVRMGGYWGAIARTPYARAQYRLHRYHLKQLCSLLVVLKK